MLLQNWRVMMPFPISRLTKMLNFLDTLKIPQGQPLCGVRRVIAMWMVEESVLLFSIQASLIYIIHLRLMTIRHALFISETSLAKASMALMLTDMGPMSLVLLLVVPMKWIDSTGALPLERISLICVFLIRRAEAMSPP